MKRNATFHLSNEALELLEGLWLEVRAMTKKGEINKSLLVEWSIKDMCKRIQESEIDIESEFYDNKK